jgi:hypothetical protein
MSFSHTSKSTMTPGILATSLPKLFSEVKNSAASGAPDTTPIPADLRKLTLDCLGVDIIAETAEEPLYPYTNSAKPYNFFNQTDLPVTVLLRHVVRAELSEAKAVLERNPALVLYKGQVTDYSGRTIEGTAYQIALGAEDVSTGKDQKGNDKNDGMAKMIRSYFKRAYHNDEKAAAEEISKQLKAQFPEKEFPEYYEVDDKKREAIIKAKNANDPDIRALEVVTQAIINADVNEIKRIPKGTKNRDGKDEYTLEVTGECAKALQVFRNYLMPRGVIKKGKHFNAQLLIKASEKYASDQYKDYPCDSPKNLLFWHQVIGYIQRYLPACAAMACLQSFYTVTDDGQSLKRDCKLAGNLGFFPLDLAAQSGLGFDHAYYSYYGIGGRLQTTMESAVAGGFSRFMSDKHSSLVKEFMQPCSNNYLRRIFSCY